MSILAAIYTIAFIFIIIFSFTRPKIGLALFIVYFLFVPRIKLQLGPISIGEKFIYLVFIFSFIIKYGKKIKGIDYSFYKPFFFLYTSIFFIILCQNSNTFGSSLNYFLTTILSSLLYPMIVYSILITEKSAIRTCLTTITICYIIITAYGLFLITMPGINPYLMVSLPIFGLEFNEAYALGYSALDTNVHVTAAEGRLFGRISSVFAHPLQYGLVLVFFACTLFYANRKNKLKLILITLATLIAIVTSGSRTPVAAIFITVIISCIFTGKIKYMLLCLTAIVLLLLLSFIVFPETIENYILTIVNSNESNIQGSNVEMRMNQLQGCFDIIKYCFWEGKGYSWTYDYLAGHDIHPKLLNFESLIFIVLCNTGMLGIIVWGIFIWLYTKKSLQIRQIPQRMLILSLFFFYITFACITGEYEYMKYFMLFYSFALAIIQTTNIKNIKNECKKTD